MKEPASKLQSALLLHQQGKLGQAEAHYKEILRLQPANFDALFLLATAAAQQQRYEEALGLFDRALKNNPRHPEALNNRGNVLKELKRYEEALASYDKSLSVRPGDAETYANRGVVLLELTRYDEALSIFDRALYIRNNHAEAWNNRGVALQELKRYDEALLSIEKALALRKEYAEAWNNRGNILFRQERFEEAAASYDKAIVYKPEYLKAYLSLGDTLAKMRHFEKALQCYEKIIVHQTDSADLYMKLAHVQQELKRYDEVAVSLEKAFCLNPDLDFLFGQKINANMKICAWKDFEESLQTLEEKIEEGKKAVAPFWMLSMTDAPLLHRKVAGIFANEKYPSNPALEPLPMRKRDKIIRIGYFSSDLRKHPGAYLMAGMFEAHNRDLFETIAFAFGPEPDTDDEMRKRISSAFDRFLDVRNMSDSEVAELSRELAVDIAIDRGGYTSHCRTGIFALRAAPLQVSYLGYPGTMGAPYIDYIIADPTVIPDGKRECFNEKIIYLPDCYQANDRKREISGRVYTRGELGLPENGFVFCCFNNNNKITPSVFKSWMKILENAEGSILWLLEDNETAARNLRMEAVNMGIDPERVIFANRLYPNSEHLARQRVADLFLDTLPYNAHTTASDALWAGLPVLTLIGESFASRVAASVLNAIRLPRLVTSTQEEYEALAVELANNPEKLRAIKEQLERNRLTTPLFDTLRFTRHIEQAYTQIYERYHAGLAPDHIFVNPED